MAQYPSSAATDANLYVAVNNKNTTLVGALTASGGNYSGTEIEVASTTGFPSTGFITIDLEIISYTGVATSPHRFTGITRGADSTTAASHSNGVFVYHHVVAAHHNVLKEEVKAIEDDLLNTNPPLRKAGGTMTGAIAMGTNKITGLGNGTAAQDAATFGQIKYLTAPVQTVSTSSFATTSSTFQTTNLSASITPSSTSSRIKITVVGVGAINAATGINALFTLFRGSTNLAVSSSASFLRIRSAAAQVTTGCVALTFIDSPASTSSLTYAVKIRNDDNATNIDFGTTQDQIMILEEIV